MPYVYVECSNGHIYRVVKTQSIPKTHCPYCGHTWRLLTTKKAWIQFREEFWRQHRKYNKD